MGQNGGFFRKPLTLSVCPNGLVTDGATMVRESVGVMEDWSPMLDGVDNERMFPNERRPVRWEEKNGLTGLLVSSEW